jgi:uncharacterized RDD family membrane protein YckC
MSGEDAGGAGPVRFEDRLTIATPEGVEVDLTLAGIGSRCIAGGLDLAVEAIVLVTLAVVLDPAGVTGVAILSSATFALIFFYDVLFEVLGGGRTPGKRIVGLRVVRSGGRPITFVRSALRNILRLIDILPFFYGVGMTVIFITERNQRLGDLAAGSVVLRDRFGDRGRGSAELPAIDPAPAAAWDVSAVSADDVAAVRAFLLRRGDLRSEARLEIAGELASRLRPLVGGAQSTLGDESFLELLVAAKAARS